MRRFYPFSQAAVVIWVKANEMAIDSETQERIVGLAEGSIAPKPGMEVHFVEVCRGNAIACSEAEIEWFDFISERSTSPAESDFRYESGLPGMAELDRIVTCPPGMFPFPELGFGTR